MVKFVGMYLISVGGFSVFMCLFSFLKAQFATPDMTSDEISKQVAYGSGLIVMGTISLLLGIISVMRGRK